MTDRNAQIEAFVENAGWGDAVVSHLAGDASNRRYLRLIRPSNAQRAVLMDAPPDKGEDVRPFVRIATYLTSVGLSAPRILHRDDEAGFLLLEDLGDALFASIVPRNPDLEDRLYSTAIDVLVHLHAQPAPDGLVPYDPATATALSALVFDWYVPGATDTTDSTERPGFEACLQDLLAEHAADCDVLIQRDYHAQNLLWLPDRKGLPVSGCWISRTRCWATGPMTSSRCCRTPAGMYRRTSKFTCETDTPSRPHRIRRPSPPPMRRSAPSAT